MKKIIIALALLVSIALASSFCSGFKEGFRAGYCNGKYSCIDPITPICPIPGIGQNTWSGGYSKGFLMGLARQR